MEKLKSRAKTPSTNEKKRKSYEPPSSNTPVKKKISSARKLSKVPRRTSLSPIGNERNGQRSSKKKEVPKSTPSRVQPRRQSRGENLSYREMDDRKADRLMMQDDAIAGESPAP